MKLNFVKTQGVMLIIIISLLGFVLSYFIYQQTSSYLKDELLLKTKIITETLDTDSIKEFVPTEQLYSQDGYTKTVNELVRILGLNIKFKNMYLFQKDSFDNIVFIIDLINALPKENIDSDIYSRHNTSDSGRSGNFIIEAHSAGLIYTEATEQLVSLFETQNAFVEGPIADQHGIWVSALTPVIDQETGKTIAVFGVDCEVTHWKWAMLNRLLFPIFMVILLYGLVFLSLRILQSRQQVLERAIRINKQRDVLSNFTMSDKVMVLGFEQTLEYLVKLLADTLDTEVASIWMLGENKESFTCNTFYSTIMTSVMSNGSLCISDFPEFFNFIKDKKLITVNDIEKHTVLKTFVGKMYETILPKSVIIANIWYNLEIIGILAIESFSVARLWQSDEESFIETISAIISQVIVKKEKDLAEKELMESNQRFENTLESITDGFMYFNQELELKFLNQNILNILELDIKWTQYHQIWEVIPKKISEIIQNLIRIATEDNTDVAKFEYIESLNKWIEFRVYPTHADVSVFISDITKKKQSEKAILENQRLSAIGEMANAFSHDFNNYLQVILANVDVLYQKLKSLSEVREYLRTLQITTSDAATRVQLLQRFAGTKNKATEYDKVNLNTVVVEAVMQATPIWKTEPEKNGIFIKVSEQIREIPNIYGNENELRSVLYNLIKNSTEALPTGGEINIETFSQNDSVFLRITDNGEGMNEEVAERVFEPFFTTRGFDAGKGLGLCGVYNIINEHGGKIRIVNTKLSEGTTFEIELPKMAVNEEPEENNQAKKKEKPVVLWVDDDAMIRQIGYDMLSIIDYDITVADGGEEALDILTQKEFDILLSDIGMPGMSGWQLMDKVDELYPNKYKRVLISGWGDQVTEEQKKEHKIDFVMAKPVKLQQMKKLLEDLWS